MVLIGRQPGHAENAPCDFQAVVRALLGVYIKDLPFVGRKFGCISQYSPILQCSRHNGRNIERLFALSLTDRGAEIAQRPDDGSLYFQHFGRFLVGGRKIKP